MKIRASVYFTHRAGYEKVEQVEIDESDIERLVVDTLCASYDEGTVIAPRLHSIDGVDL